MTEIPPRADDLSIIHDPPPPFPDMAPVADALDRLTAEVGREHDRATRREEIIDRLHAENLELRHGLLQEALTPVRAGLYRLYDMAGREAARLREEPGGNVHLASLLAAIADEVAEVLARTGAELLETVPGDPYDSARHRPVGTANGPHGHVVTVLSDGFRLGEQVLRKAEVTVGTFVDDQRKQKTEDE
ncbi:nucleotide exchange factor GrpE [Streptosporangium sp. H16]|uniref:nucleotide exchange factor GrpE n=1 Tax=Streptosporangium sp. H16 TaxID=3444184 RepID=UPI003F7A6159